MQIHLCAPLIGAAFHQYSLWFSTLYKRRIGDASPKLLPSLRQALRGAGASHVLELCVHRFHHSKLRTLRRANLPRIRMFPDRIQNNLFNLFLHQLEMFKDAQFQLMDTLTHTVSDPLVTLYRAIHDKKLKFSRPQKNLWGHQFQSNRQPICRRYVIPRCHHNPIADSC